MNKRLHISSWQTEFSLSILGEMVQIQVEGFSGPVDLLLDLIEQEQMDITALSLGEVADKYWQEIDGNGSLDPDTLADFINVGSRLLYIKSCALLPSAEPPEDLGEQIDNAAEELTTMLEEHKRFRDAVDLFRQLEEEGRRTFARMAPVKNVPLPPGLEGVTLDNLLSAVKEALAQKPPEPEEAAVLHIEPVTVNEKMTEVGEALVKNRGRLPFRPLLAACQTRTEIVVLFLAILEMIKGGGLWAEQETPFGDIELIEAAAEPA
jgi:segregation and condensation protein A